MKITFEGETLQHVVASIGDFLHELTKNEPWVLSGKDPTDLPYPEPEEKPEPTSRRKRRAKTSTADAKTTAYAPVSHSADEQLEPTTRRRRARRTEPPAPKTAKGRTRKRAGASTSPSDDLKDTDLSKAASALADATNPKVVLDLLEEFGVEKVGELEGDARRAFLDAAAEIVADGERT